MPLLLFSHPVMSDFFQPRGLQHTRPPCLSPSPGVCPSSCPLHQWCHPAISFLTPSSSAFNVSQHQGLFRWVSCSHHQVTKYWGFSLSISSSNEYSGLTFFKIDWFDLLTAQGTLRSLLQHHSSKASILWHSAFFLVQLSQLYMTTGKTIALTIWTFVSRVLFNTLSRFVISFLPRSNHLLN